MTAPDPPDQPGSGSLEIRPPLQQRSREAWMRILDAGLSLLEEQGYEGFTIAAICRRAEVPPRALYARADTKDALFLAVYEYGIARVRASHAVFDDESRWHGLTFRDVVSRAVRELDDIFTRHAAFLRAIVLISGVHPEINRRGARYTNELGDLFTTRVCAAGATVDRPDAAVRAVFTMVFSTLVIRTAYGPAFTAPAGDDGDFVERMCDMAGRYLVG